MKEKVRNKKCKNGKGKGSLAIIGMFARKDLNNKQKR